MFHEVAHLGGHELTGFKVAWNILVGVPTLTPSTFFTGNHRDHHTQRVYGTPQDPEYVINICERGNVLQFACYLMRTLPSQSPYRTLEQPGWWSVAGKMLSRSPA